MADYPTTYEPLVNNSISGLTFGPTSSGGPNPGGFGSGQIGTGVASDYQGGTPYDSGDGASYGASAISAVTTIATTFMKVAAEKDRQEQKTKEIMASMDATVEEYEFQSSVNEQQRDAVNRVVGDKMSVTGLERLKNKASLKASAAMTGTSGGTTNAVIQEASIIEMMDNAVIVAQGRAQKTQLRQQLQGQYISAQNKLNNLAAGMQSPTSAGLGMIDAGLQGFTQGYMMLPPSERRKYFGQSSEGYK